MSNQLQVMTRPHTYMAAYSPVPFKVYKPDYNLFNKFKYVINIVYDTEFTSSIQPISYLNQVYSLVTLATPHSLKVGDSILLDDSNNNNKQTGYYNVIDAPSATEVIIDLFPSVPFVNYPVVLSKFYKFKLDPDLDGYGKLDASNVLKDLVSENFKGQEDNYAELYEGKDTKRCFGVLYGYELEYKIDFTSNTDINGNVGFYNTDITSLSGIPLEIGQPISIQQNPVAWGYNSITNNNGKPRFNSTNTHDFLSGQLVQVQGETSLTSYNGFTSVFSVDSSSSLTTSQSFIGSSNIPGFIYGIPRPTYNTVATILDIYIDNVLGLVIKTDLTFTTPTTNLIGGTIKYGVNELIEVPNEIISYDDFCVYNARVERKDYTIDYFDKYVIQQRSFSLNNISTMLDKDTHYRVERSSIGFLLLHGYIGPIIQGVRYRFYDRQNNELGVIKLDKFDNDIVDFYVPIGLDQISQSQYLNISGVFNNYFDDIYKYEVDGYNDITTPFSIITNSIKFILTDDCSSYDIYHLIFKDKYGSFIPIPFIYKSKDFIENEKKSYYQKDGNWDNDSFGYKDYGRGEKTFSSRSRESITLNSGWLKEFEIELIRELIQSPSTYIQTPDNRIFSCTLNENKVELYKQQNDPLYNYSFNVRYGFNEFRF